MNPPYQPPGPQHALPQPLLPAEGTQNYQRSGSSQLPLPAPRQLLQYADSYRQATARSSPRIPPVSPNLPPPHHVAPPPPPPQHYQQHHHQQQQLPALNPNQSLKRDNFTAETLQPPANDPATDGKPAQVPLASVSRVDDVVGYKYQLDVVQQPKRARMCGFGDKDRRPITPPPCVRLSIIDINTGKEINYNEIDHAMFVLNVDLWNGDGSREVNLVRSSAAASATAASSSSSLPAVPPRNGADAPLNLNTAPPGRDGSHGYPPNYAGQPNYHRGDITYRPGGTYAPSSSQHYHQHPGYGHDGSIIPNSSGNHARTASVTDGYSQDQGAMPRLSAGGGQPQGMFTRNLIGSVSVSAFNLCDTEEKRGIWFVLQDLSVRTEGNFRLRFSFVNVGPRGGRIPPDGNSPKVTTGRAPILASSYSEVFSVFSAKKFPGVCESTPLSKTFAAQGIKIPIRKETGGKGDDDDGYAD